MTTEPRPLGAASRQSCALAVLALPVLARIGAVPSMGMLRRVLWAHEHGIDHSTAHEVFRIRGIHPRSKE